MTSILFLTPSPPLPATQGAPMRNITMLRAAAERGRVDLLTFTRGEDAAPELPTELTELCTRVQICPKPHRSRMTRALSLARSRLPDMAHRLWSTTLLGTLRQWVSTQKYDLIQIEGIEMARFALELQHRPRLVYDDHNVEYLLQQRAFEVDRAHPARLHAAAYSAIQAEALRAFERRVCETADQVVAVSAEDAEKLSMLAHCQPAIIPNAIDIRDYPFQPTRPDRAPALLFPGTMDFRPNADAAIWFIERVLPRLTGLVPEVHCFFAGRNPSDELIRHGQHNPSVVVTGAVDSMEPYWDRATICVLPLHVGGGTRFKALEAMAYGLPIVSTRLGMEGIAARPGLDYLCSDDPVVFAESVAGLLRSSEARAALARPARALVEQRYSQREVTARLHEVYDRLGL